MKKVIFLLAASVFAFQFAGLSQTRVGITAGVSIASMHGTEAEEGSGRGGLMAGIMVERQIKKSAISFRPSISYVQKGETLPHPTGTLIDKSYIALRYAELNADFLYYVSGVQNAGFFVGAGPSISFNLPSKKVTVTDDVKTTTTVHFGKDPINDLRGTDWGINFAAGWRTKSGFLFNFNFNKGIRNLVTEGSDGDLKNTYFGIQLGCFLNNK